MPKRTQTPITPEVFLTQFNPEIQALANRLRTLVKDALPDVIERVYPGWKLIGYRNNVNGKEIYIGFVFPALDRVVLGFEWGVLLNDPNSVLEGNGSQVRQFTVRQEKDIRPKLFKAFIIEAARMASLSKAEKTKLLLSREALKEIKRSDSSRQVK
jgi:hypothetical protein